MRLRIAQNYITDLPPNGVFVFGSNLEGRHGKGASVIAKKYFGARKGVGRGLVGRSYALPTKRSPYVVMTQSEIYREFSVFLQCVAEHTELDFYLTKVGCGLSNYEPKQMAELLWRAAGGKNIARFTNLLIPSEFASHMPFL